MERSILELWLELWKRKRGVGGWAKWSDDGCHRHGRGEWTTTKLGNVSALRNDWLHFFLFLFFLAEAEKQKFLERIKDDNSAEFFWWLEQTTNSKEQTKTNKNNRHPPHDELLFDHLLDRWNLTVLLPPTPPLTLHPLSSLFLHFPQNFLFFFSNDNDNNDTHDSCDHYNDKSSNTSHVHVTTTQNEQHCEYE